MAVKVVLVNIRIVYSNFTKTQSFTGFRLFKLQTFAVITDYIRELAFL